MFRHPTKTMIFLLLAAIVLVACSAAGSNKPQPTPTKDTSSQLANPASQNCEKEGGKVVIQKRGDGGEYGVCVFTDNRQCEEWAMARGECPVGGLDITGYVTVAAQFCVISGGEYTVTGNSNQDNEQGACNLKNGNTCDAWDFYNGKCR